MRKEREAEEASPLAFLSNLVLDDTFANIEGGKVEEEKHFCWMESQLFFFLWL